jgi:hypothetical protein
MRLARKSGKITEVTIQKLRVEKLPCGVCDQYSVVAQDATTGAEARVDSGGYAALKRRSSTVLPAFVHDARRIHGFFRSL